MLCRWWMFFFLFLFNVNLLKMKSPKRATTFRCVNRGNNEISRDCSLMFWEMCFRPGFSLHRDDEGGNENVFVNNWRPGGSSVLRVRKRHSCWPFNQRNCRSIKFEPVPIPCQRQCALHALLFHEIEKFLSFRVETTSSIMESSRKKDGRVGCLKLIDIVLFLSWKIFLPR